MGQRVILDACMPRVLGHALIGHGATTTSKLGLQSLDDGPLLDAISGLCDVFITVDKSMRWQQRLDLRSFAVVVLRAKTNRIEDLLPLVPELLLALPDLTPGDVRVIGA